jgi:hypothetical protein
VVIRRPAVRLAAAANATMWLRTNSIVPSRLTRTAATTVLRHAASRFAVPAILGAGVVTWVHTGLYAAAPALLRPVGLACSWTALALGAIQSCRITADVGAGVAVPPRPGRLRLGLWTL